MRLSLLFLATVLLIPTVVLAKQRDAVGAPRTSSSGRPSPLLTQDDLSPPHSVPVQDWLDGPDRQDFAWKVQLSQYLTLQHRHEVRVLVTIQGGDFLKGVKLRQLDFITKVADEGGHWLEGQSYDHFVPPANLSKGSVIHSEANLYLRPGNYTIAVIAYDSVNHRGNVWRARLTVPSASGPLAGLDRDFPVVEFLTPATENALILNGTEHDQQPLGHATGLLPFANKVPLRIDVIVNLSNIAAIVSSQLKVKGSNCVNYVLSYTLNEARPSDSVPGYPCSHLELSGEDSALYKTVEQRALRVGNLISQLAPQTGCVRFSAVDGLRQELISDRADASNVDWQSLSKRIASTKIDTVEVSAFHAKEHAIWLKEFIDRVNEDNYACGLPNGTPDHVLVMVTMALPFPPYTDIWPVKSQKPRPRTYLVEFGVAKNQTSQARNQAEVIMAPLKPKLLRAAGWDDLPRQLDSIIRDLTVRSK